MLIVLAILAFVWFWAGATMSEGPTRMYQCSVGNQRPFACKELPS